MAAAQMNKRYLSPADFLREAQSLAKEHKNFEDFLEELYKKFTIKWKPESNIRCFCGCGAVAKTWDEAKGWYKISIAQLSPKKKWEPLSADEELYFVNVKHFTKILTSLPY